LTANLSADFSISQHCKLLLEKGKGDLHGVGSEAEVEAEAVVTLDEHINHRTWRRLTD